MKENVDYFKNRGKRIKVTKMKGRRETSEIGTFPRYLREKELVYNLLKKRKIELFDDEKERMFALQEGYTWVKESFSLSEIDYDILRTGMVLAEIRGPCAIMSNDTNIRKAIMKVASMVDRAIVKLEVFSSNGTGLFVPGESYN